MTGKTNITGLMSKTTSVYKISSLQDLNNLKNYSNWINRNKLDSNLNCVSTL